MSSSEYSCVIWIKIKSRSQKFYNLYGWDKFITVHFGFYESENKFFDFVRYIVFLFPACDTGTAILEVGDYHHFLYPFGIIHVTRLVKYWSLCSLLKMVSRILFILCYYNVCSSLRVALVCSWDCWSYITYC